MYFIFTPVKWSSRNDALVWTSLWYVPTGRKKMCSGEADNKNNNKYSVSAKSRSSKLELQSFNIMFATSFFFCVICSQVHLMRQLILQSAFEYVILNHHLRYEFQRKNPIFRMHCGKYQTPSPNGSDGERRPTIHTD